MPPEEQAEWGNKSHTLQFIRAVGIVSKIDYKSLNKIKGVNEVEYKQMLEIVRKKSKVVGFILKSSENIIVPQIDILKNHDTGISLEDINYIEILAETEFCLSHYEFMYLLLRKEYGGRCSDGIQEDGVLLTPRIKDDKKSKQKQIPVPIITLKRVNKAVKGSVKENMEFINYISSNGENVIKEQYQEKFGALVKKERFKIKIDVEVPAPVAYAVALSRELGVEASLLNYKNKV